VSRAREIAEREIRGLLEDMGREPPALHDVSVSYRECTQNFVVELFLTDGRRFGFTLPYAGSFGRHLLSESGFAERSVRDISDLYNRLAEDHLIRHDLREARRRLTDMARQGAPPHVLVALNERIAQAHAHAQRFHGVDAGRRPADRSSARLRGAEISHIACDEAAEVPSAVFEELRSRLDRDAADAFRMAVGVPSEPSRNITAREVQLRHAEMLARPSMVEWSRSIDLRPGAINWVGFSELYDPFSFGNVGTDEAQERGLQLLRSWLSPEQLAQYEKDRAFDVRGGKTGKRYRIRHGRQMNIDEIDAKGRRVCGWCFLPQGQLVAGDVMLAQKIALETDEERALAVANRF